MKSKITYALCSISYYLSGTIPQSRLTDSNCSGDTYGVLPHPVLLSRCHPPEPHDALAIYRIVLTSSAIAQRAR